MPTREWVNSWSISYIINSIFRNHELVYEKIDITFSKEWSDILKKTIAHHIELHKCKLIVNFEFECYSYLDIEDARDALKSTQLKGKVYDLQDYNIQVNINNLII